MGSVWDFVYSMDIEEDGEAMGREGEWKRDDGIEGMNYNNILRCKDGPC